MQKKHSNIKEHKKNTNSISNFTKNNDNIVNNSENSNTDLILIENTDNVVVSNNENGNQNTIQSNNIENSNENTIENSNNDTNNIFQNIDNSIHNIRMAAVHLNLLLQDHNNLNFKDTFSIQSALIEYILKPTSLVLISYLSNILSDINQILSALENPFIYCKTEYILNESLSKFDLIANLEQFTINNEIEEVLKQGEVQFHENNSKGLIMPLNFQFRKIFEKDNTLNECFEAIKKIENNGLISNFIQGDLWKQKKDLYPDKIRIPYFVYFDDAEINNPLGSHAGVHSIGAVYYSFPIFKNSSKLSNIFVAGFLKTSDVKTYGNDPCFYQLIDEIIDLEKNGVLIKSSEGIILGDNLGLNTILDFSKSFSANFSCRLCKVTKDSLKSLCEEKSELLRN